MPTFIDESGGFGWDDTSSKHFTLAAIWFETPEDAVACEDSIARVRKDLGLPATFEFKFSRNSDEQRIAFVAAVSVCRFQYVTCTLRKRRKGVWLTGQMWRQRPYFYERVIAPVVDQLGACYRMAEGAKAAALNEPVVYDEHSDNVYRDTLREQFRRPKAASGRSLVGKVRQGRSRTDSLIQLADMVCGSFAHSLDKSSVYVDALKARELIHLFVS